MKLYLNFNPGPTYIHIYICIQCFISSQLRLPRNTGDLIKVVVEISLDLLKGTVLLL